MSSLWFAVIWSDDGFVRLDVRAASPTHSAYHETYLDPEALAKFAGALENFPTGSAEVVLTAGTETKDPKYYDHLCLRVFLVKPTGQSALEVVSSMPGSPPDRATSHFYIRGLPWDFNRMGAAIKAWLADTSEPLLIEWVDGW